MKARLTALLTRVALWFKKIFGSCDDAREAGPSEEIRRGLRVQMSSPPSTRANEEGAQVGNAVSAAAETAELPPAVNGPVVGMEMEPEGEMDPGLEMRDGSQQTLLGEGVLDMNKGGVAVAFPSTFEGEEEVNVISETPATSSIVATSIEPTSTPSPNVNTAVSEPSNTFPSNKRAAASPASESRPSKNLARCPATSHLRSGLIREDKGFTFHPTVGGLTIPASASPSPSPLPPLRITIPTQRARESPSSPSPPLPRRPRTQAAREARRNQHRTRFEHVLARDALREDKTEQIVVLRGFALDMGFKEDVALKKRSSTGYWFRQQKVRVPKGGLEGLDEEGEWEAVMRGGI